MGCPESVLVFRCGTLLYSDKNNPAKMCRVSFLDCKAQSADSKTKYVFRHNPHMRRAQRILRPLSRIRAELAGEFSLAIR
jgi:hypothetical protein